MKSEIQDLIEALTIFSEYLEPDSAPTHCEHDTLTVVVEYKLVSDEHKRRLDELGFTEDEFGMFKSYRFGSA